MFSRASIVALNSMQFEHNYLKKTKQCNKKSAHLIWFRCWLDFPHFISQSAFRGGVCHVTRAYVNKSGHGKLREEASGMRASHDLQSFISVGFLEATGRAL